MSTIVTRAGKGSPLTHTEVDNNFTNLNTDKYQSGNTIIASAGTVSAPALSTTGDTNTGIYFPAADTIAFTEGGVEAARFDSSGRLLIGNTASASDNLSGTGIQSSLQVKNNTAIRTTDGTATLFLTRAGTSVSTGTTVGRISFQQPLFSDSFYSGPIADINATTASGSSGYPGNLIFRTTADGGTDPTERMRITSDGNVGIGTSSPSTRLHVAGGLQYITNTSGNAAGLELAGNGNTAGTTSLFIGQGGSGIAGILQRANAALYLGTNDTERMRIDSSGNLLVGITSARANAGDVQVSKGISFPATQSAQSDANTLDDYEEGTYTPTASNFTVTGTPTITGRYTKIGNIIHFSVVYSSTGTIAYSASALITVPFLGRRNTGNITMRVNSNSAAFDGNQSGAQCNTDEVSFDRFFVGNFTTTSSGQALVFAGTYEFYA